MAEQQHFEGFDSEPEELSRSAHKREAQAIRKLALQIKLPIWELYLLNT